MSEKYKGWKNNFEGFKERNKYDRRNLDDLIRWLEYNRISGMEASRQSIEQENFWADELKALLSMEGVIARFVHPESDAIWYKHFNTKKEVEDYFEDINKDGHIDYTIIHSNIVRL